ncbi:hypothetical protein PINS_up015300 [Pythium insidiosum]|nr:hypothetical protein PINS_up015300 [Pythium insidiosum]
MLHRLADVGPATNAVVACLSFQDALSLYVVALDDATRALDAIARCLRYDSAAAGCLSLEQGSDHLPLAMAVAHGCLVAARRMKMEEAGRRGRKTSPVTTLLASFRPESEGQHPQRQEDDPSERSNALLPRSKKLQKRETRCQIMQWLNRHRPFIYPSAVMYTAASRGDMALFIYDVRETALVRHQLPPHRWTTVEMMWPLDECNFR